MLRIILGLVGLSAVLASAVSAQPPFPSNEFRFIGFTHTHDAFHTIAGDQGMILMHALCQDDFGLDSRMCTSEEFWLSPNAEAPAAPAAGAADAWLHIQSLTVDFAGLAQNPPADGSINCRGWTNLDTVTVVVTTDGKPNLATCNVTRPVTCCAPIQ